jgi:hypothetical protein
VTDYTDCDLSKFTYHEGARIIRSVQDRICELAYAGAPPNVDDRESLCDKLIELHQLMYEVTLHTLRPDDPLEDPDYHADEVYSDGRPVLSRVQLPVESEDPIPIKAYRSDIGEEVPPGGDIYVWRPGDLDHTVPTGEEAATAAREGAWGAAWKGSADLRASGLVAWVRGDDGHMVKRPGVFGRLQAVCRITPAGLEKCRDLLTGEPDGSTGSDETEAANGV